MLRLAPRLNTLFENRKLLDCARRNHWAGFCGSLSDGASINTQNEQGMTPLMIIAEQRNAAFFIKAFGSIFQILPEEDIERSDVLKRQIQYFQRAAYETETPYDLLDPIDLTLKNNQGESLAALMKKWNAESDGAVSEMAEKLEDREFLQQDAKEGLILQAAAKASSEQNEECLEYLRFGGDPDYIDDQGVSAKALAALNQNAPLLSIFEKFNEARRYTLMRGSLRSGNMKWINIVYQSKEMTPERIEAFLDKEQIIEFRLPAHGAFCPNVHDAVEYIRQIHHRKVNANFETPLEKRENYIRLCRAAAPRLD